MVHLASLFPSILLAGSAFALPLTEESSTSVIEETIEKRFIGHRVFNKLVLMEQYASAAYCRTNQNSPGDQITCASNTCELVEAANATSAIEYENHTGTDVTGFVALDPSNKLIAVVFRGTHTIENWLANLDFDKVDTGLCPGCTAHHGFWKSWLDSRKAVLESVKTLKGAHPSYQIVATGHSLGGAIATLATAEMRILHKYKVHLYTYGAPRIADAVLSDLISKQGDNWRVTHTNDIVPTVPGLIMGFVHVSPEYYIKKKNNMPVSRSDVKVFEGNANVQGNAGHMLPRISPHMWYFNQISACSQYRRDLVL